MAKFVGGTPQLKKQMPQSALCIGMRDILSIRILPWDIKYTRITLQNPGTQRLLSLLQLQVPTNLRSPVVAIGIGEEANGFRYVEAVAKRRVYVFPRVEKPGQETNQTYGDN